MVPQKWYSASGSTPVLNKHSPVPLLQEHSHKSGIVLLGVLLNKLKLYTGSDLDILCNLDILLPLDTLWALSVLLFLVSGSTPNRLIFCQWEYLLYMLLHQEYSQKPKINYWEGFQSRVSSGSNILKIIISCQDHSHCTILVCLGLLPEVLYHCTIVFFYMGVLPEALFHLWGGTPIKVV